MAASHNKALYRTNLRSRQVVIDTDDESTRDLSEKEITAKARLALDATFERLGYEHDPDQHDGIKILGATKLKNGGILLELNTPDAVGFLTDDETLTEFLAAFSGHATIKTRGFQCIAEFVPTSFSPSTPSALRAVESDSRLQSNTILKARWIKPVERRSPGQKVAHLFLDFDSPYTANRAIDNGIFIENKKVNVRKAKIEPRRCLKCQVIGARHIANACSSPNDVCGYCRGKHRTAECKVSDPTDYRCANCKQSGHAAWDKTCPEYKKQAQLLDERCPENKFRLFPSDDDPLSWECLDNHTSTLPDLGSAPPPPFAEWPPELEPDEPPADGPIARGRNTLPHPPHSRARAPAPTPAPAPPTPDPHPI
ncbi:hypothetical protein A0H81_05496 [Grifola frondosa]|uniref:Nucleic-acid-binding protein from transposon X-element n=1 Tax=Grifola frondosa TaxID=5627 RepID=A0A1C7MBU4_GRIFR|nr:hypothetical protein A0H81_05496 [Grifola frondosa]